MTGDADGRPLPMCAAAKRKTIVVLARHSVPERVTIVVMAWGEQRRSPVTICHEVAVVSSRKGTDAVGATAAAQDPAIALRLRPPRLLLLSPVSWTHGRSASDYDR